LLSLFAFGLELAIALGEDRWTVAGQLVRRRNVSDRAMKVYFIVMTQ
jgi:hypothetical protein